MMMMMMMMMILDQISVCMAQNLPAVCMPQIDASFFLVLWNCGDFRGFNDGMMVVQWTPRIGVTKKLPMIKP